jgi:hypothetical protein
MSVPMRGPGTERPVRAAKSGKPDGAKLQPITALSQRMQVPGAADKAASLGGESPLPSIAWFGRLAYPMHVPVTVRVLLGRRSHGCPAALGPQR